MKLSEFAKRTGVSYITAYRWFSEGKMPVKAYKSDTGTIIVDDEDFNEKKYGDFMKKGSSTQAIHQLNEPPDALAFFLKKTVEFSKNNSTVEEFAAFIISNFTLNLAKEAKSNNLKKAKPSGEEIRKQIYDQIKPTLDRASKLKEIKNKMKSDIVIPSEDIMSIEDLNSLIKDKELNLEESLQDNALSGQFIEVYDKHNFDLTEKEKCTDLSDFIKEDKKSSRLRRNKSKSG